MLLEYLAFDAIRLIAHIPGVIVIVGIDDRIAFKAMGQAYSDYADAVSGRSQEEVARDYLGKIIQLPIRLEAPGVEALKPFVDEKLFPSEDRVSNRPRIIDDFPPDGDEPAVEQAI